MAAGDRVRSALMFALVVASTQAACLFVIWIVGLLPPAYPTEKRAGTGPLFQVVTFGLLLAVPVLLHDGPVARRWPPRASRQATIRLLPRRPRGRARPRGPARGQWVPGVPDARRSCGARGRQLCGGGPAEPVRVELLNRFTITWQ